LCQGAAPALLRSLLGLQPHLRSASAQAEQVPPALAGGCDPETLALHAEQMRSLGRLCGHIPGGALFRAPASLAVIRTWRNARRGT